MTVLLKILRRWFLTGLIVWVPFVGSIYLFYFVFTLLDGWAQPYAQQWLGRRLPGLGLGLLVASTLLAGALVSNFIGKTLVTLLEGIVARIPGFNVVYRFFKDFANTLLNRERGAFREVVALRYPSENTLSIGFVTGPVPPTLRTDDEPEERLLVFIMMAFSPATGFLVAVKRSDVIPLTIPVDEAFKLILTGGVVKTLDATALPPAGNTAATAENPAPRGV